MKQESFLSFLICIKFIFFSSSREFIFPFFSFSGPTLVLRFPSLSLFTPDSVLPWVGSRKPFLQRADPRFSPINVNPPKVDFTSLTKRGGQRKKKSFSHLIPFCHGSVHANHFYKEQIPGFPQLM